MKNLLFYSTLFIALISCSKSPKCWGDDKIKGEIISYVESECYYPKQLNKDNSYVVKSYNDLEANPTFYPCTFGVDFNKHSIIGQILKGQCNVKVIRELTIDKKKKTYNLKTTIKECGACQKAAIVDKMLLVPKIPNGYDVEFEVIMK